MSTHKTRTMSQMAVFWDVYPWLSGVSRVECRELSNVSSNIKNWCYVDSASVQRSQ
jgi:hypothetical protein